MHAVPKRPGRVIVLVGIAVSVLLVAVAVGFVLLPPRQTADVAVPPPDAAPEQVVAAYLEALDAHDCDTAEALTAADSGDQARSWCEDVASLTDVEIGDHVEESPEHSGYGAPAEVANVPVSFDLSWRLLHDDGSMDEGATAWGYLLVRESPDAPWRIFSQGLG